MDNMNREILAIDVLFVGAGPASLAGALSLKNQLKQSNTEISIAIIEKAPPIKVVYAKYFIFSPPITSILIAIHEIINEELKSG